MRTVREQLGPMEHEVDLLLAEIGKNEIPPVNFSKS